MNTFVPTAARLPSFVVVTVALAVLCGCPSEAEGPVEPEGPVFSMLAGDIEGGAILGAHVDGDTLFFVGGEVDGSSGTIYQYTADDAAGSLCREADSFRGTLWWAHGVVDGEWYAVGDKGLIVHSVDGVRTEESVTTDATLYGVFVDDNRVIAVGGDVRGTRLGEIWMRDQASGAGTWTKTHADVDQVLFKVWQSWIVGQSVGYRLDATDTLVAETLPIDATEEPDLLTVVGRSDDDLFAVGGGAGAILLHKDATEWTSIEVDVRCTFQPLNGVWTAAGEDVFVAGFAGGVGRWDGSEWQCPPDRLTGRDFHVVMGFGDDVFFAGGNLFQQTNNVGAIARYGGDATELGAVTVCE